ncbi:MAG: hypothetical protein AB7F19_05075 [Candidatus Babeliales bacterium]
MLKKLVSLGFIFYVCTIVLTACTQETVATRLNKSLFQVNREGTKLFGYNLDLELAPTQSPNDTEITISAHGYGSNKKRGINLAKNAPMSGQILTFNLPDYDCLDRKLKALSHGTINEILPFLYALKTVLNAGAKRVNLYGFSAGGGVIVNALGILNGTRFDAELTKIGITGSDKAAMLKAVENGIVILEVPLKSMEGIIKGRGPSQELEYIARQYKENNLRPIDTLAALKGLKLHIIVYFENPDEIIYNDDDAEYIEKLEEANALGTTKVIFGNNGGHNSYHKELWDMYAECLSAVVCRA